MVWAVGNPEFFRIDPFISTSLEWEEAGLSVPGF